MIKVVKCHQFFLGLLSNCHFHLRNNICSMIIIKVIIILILV